MVARDDLCIFLLNEELFGDPQSHRVVIMYLFLFPGIQSYSQLIIGVSNHLLSIVFRFDYHSQFR